MGKANSRGNGGKGKGKAGSGGGSKPRPPGTVKRGPPKDGRLTGNK